MNRPRYTSYIYGILIIMSMMMACRPAVIRTETKTSSLPLENEKYGADTEAEAVIAPYRAELEKEMNVVAGHFAHTMPKVKGEPETLLGNFVADLCLVQARALGYVDIDACLLNFGGLRSTVDSGVVTVGDLYTLMPFDNELVLIDLSSSEVDSMFHYLAKVGGQPVSDMRLIIKDGMVMKSEIGGASIEKGRTYRILTSDYLATGGDNMTFLTHSRRSGYEIIGLKVRDAIIQHVMQMEENDKVVRSELDGRIQRSN